METMGEHIYIHTYMSADFKMTVGGTKTQREQSKFCLISTNSIPLKLAFYETEEDIKDKSC